MSKLQSRSLVVGLLLSLTINILIVGMFIGRHNAGPSMQPDPVHLGWILRGMDRDTRKDIRPLMKQHAESSQSLRDQMQTSHRKLADVISTEPFDGEALRLSFEEVRRTSEAFQQSSHEHLIKIIATLDQEQRQQLLKGLQRHQHRPRRHPKES